MGENNRAGVVTGFWCRLGTYFVCDHLQNPHCCISVAALQTDPVQASEGIQWKSILNL